MSKKMTLLAMAVGAIAAFVAPAAANATILTDSSGTLQPGATVFATSTNTETTTSTGTISCAKVEFDLTVVSNGTPAEIFGGGEAEGCKVTQNSAPIVITLINIEEILINGGGTGEMTFTFVSDIAGVLTCHFSGTVPITYTPTTDLIHIAGGLVGAGANCPSAAAIHGTFTLKTANGDPVTIH